MFMIIYLISFVLVMIFSIKMRSTKQTTPFTTKEMLMIILLGAIPYLNILILIILLLTAIIIYVFLKITIKFIDTMFR